MKHQKRILIIGAHPDDADILCGGTAIKLARAGHAVKFVSATNGDTGHMVYSREETARIRNKEMAASAKAGGLEYEILPHDCGLEASVANRREMVRLIRSFAPDVVVTHRTCDYHPDHRATAQLVQDTAYVGMVPHFCEDTPIPEVAPVYAFSYDRFVDPRPFRIDAAVEIDSVLEEKLKIMSCHKSQFFQWLPWVAGDRDIMSRKLTRKDKRELLMVHLERLRLAADDARDYLKRLYGTRIGAKITYAEVFEQSPYSRVVSREEFQRLFEP